MRFDGASVANGVPGGVCYREIDLLGAILRDAYGRMRSQGNVAEAFPRTAPAAGGVQSIAAIILGRGIAQLFLRQNGLAGEEYGPGITGRRPGPGVRRAARPRFALSRNFTPAPFPRRAGTR